MFATTSVFPKQIVVTQLFDGSLNTEVVSNIDKSVCDCTELEKFRDIFRLVWSAR